MTLVKWNPRPINTLGGFDAMIESIFDPRKTYPSSRKDKWKPDVDINETDNSFMIKADIPGLTKKDMKIDILNDVLTISGERNDRITDDDDCYHYRERLIGAFSRSFNIPEIVNQDKITANFKNGILIIELGKKDKILPKKIEIKVG